MEDHAPKTPLPRAAARILCKPCNSSPDEDVLCGRRAANRFKGTPVSFPKSGALIWYIVYDIECMVYGRWYIVHGIC